MANGNGPTTLAPSADGKGLVQVIPGKSAQDLGVRFVRSARGGGNAGHYEDAAGKRFGRISDISSAVVDKGGALAGWTANQCELYLKQELATIAGKWAGRIPSEVEIADLARRMKGEYRYAKEAAADVGTMVHLWIQRYVTGFQQRLDEDTPLAAQAELAFIGWANGSAVPTRPYQLRPVAVEVMLCHPEWRIAGTCDFLGLHMPLEAKKVQGVWVHDPAFPVLYAVRDWKTASGAYPDQLLQCALYACCVERMWGVKVASIGAVVCPKTGGKVILDHADKEFTDRDRAAAEAAVRLASYTKGDEIWLGLDWRSKRK